MPAMFRYEGAVKLTAEKLLSEFTKHLGVKTGAGSVRVAQWGDTPIALKPLGPGVILMRAPFGADQIAKAALSNILYGRGSGCVSC